MADGLYLMALDKIPLYGGSAKRANVNLFPKRAVCSELKTSRRFRRRARAAEGRVIIVVGGSHNAAIEAVEVTCGVAAPVASRPVSHGIWVTVSRALIVSPSIE